MLAVGRSDNSPPPRALIFVLLAGVVFADEAAALERRLLGVQEPGTNRSETAQLSGSV
jgi:hypothetical protein